jgi:hypothetical protein
MDDRQQDTPLVVTAVRTGIREGIAKAVTGAVAAALLAGVSLAWQKPDADQLPRWRGDVVQSFTAIERRAQPGETRQIDGATVAVYREAGEVRKLASTAPDGEVTELYYTDGKLVFAYQHPTDVPGGLAADPQSGDRFYFHTGPVPLISRTRIFLWIGPHQTRVREGAEFKLRGRRMAERADALLSAVKARS